MYKYLMEHTISNISSNKIKQSIQFIQCGMGKLRVADNLAIAKVNGQVKLVHL
ncbi:hypothetical protein FACS1894166_04460 [Bacilli bacterium]|nr:hypothetical protein FACS1894166_04460 [Bacilli bacterium]